MTKTLLCLLVMLGFVLLGSTQTFAENDGPDDGLSELCPSGLDTSFDIGTVNLTEEEPEPADPEPCE